jgi:UPF0716 family protein affecting phage T7 exclusion
MLEIMKFIFLSFWIWAGTTIMLLIISVSFGELLRVIRGE